MLKKYHVVVIALGMAGVLPVHVGARSTVLSGGVSGGYDYSERNYDVNEAEEDAVSAEREDDKTTRFVITPYIRIVSEAPRDTATLEYAPSLFYDNDESDYDINQTFSLDYQRFLTRQWTFQLSDTFVDTDDFNSYGTPDGLFDEQPSEGVTSVTPTQDDNLRDEEGRRRYYTNKLVLSTEYTYLEDSMFSFGYGWNILRNDEDEGGESYEDYDKHELNASISHQLDSQWNISGYALYVMGKYDPPTGREEEGGSGSDDLQEYHTGIALASEFVPHHPVTLKYDFSMTDYEEEDVDSSQIHNLNLGYQWISSPRLELSLGAGPTYTKQDDDNDAWSVNGYLNLSYLLEKGIIIVSSNAGTEFDNFSGTDERGYTEFWQTRADLIYELMQNLKLGLYVYYRDETRDELVVDDSTESNTGFNQEDSSQYATGASLNYNFYENYSVAFSYGYVQQTADNPDDEYEDHRIQLTLSYNNDFMKW